MYTMDHSDIIIYSFMENSIGPKRVNEIREYVLSYLLYCCRPAAAQKLVQEGVMSIEGMFLD